MSPATLPTILQGPREWPRVLLPTDLPWPPPTDAADLDAAVAAGAFQALQRSVRELGAEGTIAAIAQSGLRGRGGGGFPTGEKWRICAATAADRRYVVVNAYEADPAVFTTRLLLQTNPFAVLEGVAIAAMAVGAQEAVIGIRADAREAIRVLEAAIVEAESAGYLGEDVLETGREIHVVVRPLQGAYMLGEETVLLKGLEGKRGQAEQEPPYPATRGLFGRPTLVHNPQTLAAIPAIIRQGPQQYAALGSKASPGTTLVQLSGSVANPGVAEIPLGTPLRDIVALAGGVPKGHTLKALLVGGPSGGILPPSALDVLYEYDALDAAGAHVGSGSVVVADERACVVDLATLLTRYCADEACGKAIPCRIGLRRLYEVGQRLCDGEPRQDDPTRLEDLAADIVASGLCDHERRATLPLTSVLRNFRDEFDDHFIRSRCPAGVCHPMTTGAPAAAGPRA